MPWKRNAIGAVDHKGRLRAESERVEWDGKEELNGMWEEEEQQREFLERG